MRRPSSGRAWPSSSSRPSPWLIPAGAPARRRCLEASTRSQAASSCARRGGAAAQQAIASASRASWRLLLGQVFSEAATSRLGVASSRAPRPVAGRVDAAVRRAAVLQGREDLVHALRRTENQLAHQLAPLGGRGSVVAPADVHAGASRSAALASVSRCQLGLELCLGVECGQQH